jgi:D-alanyl-D-alanine carboxypeptidase/D-alanyl-D-alanine-endopeptidase (penicillin-binding protein 4)
MVALFAQGLPICALAAKDGELAEKASALIGKAGFKEKDFSISIGRHAIEDSLLSVNAEEALIPASITKIVTAAAVLKEIPPGTKVKTKLVGQGEQKGERWKGDLCLKGGGDPGFVSESMWFLVNAFVRTGITKVDGDILVDGSLFDHAHFDESRQKQRVDRAYDAPVSALSFNWNSINVFVRPGSKVGESAQVFLDPENEYTILKGDVKTLAPGKKTNLMVDRTDGSKKGDLIQVGGTISRDAPEQVVYTSITQPEIWSGQNLKGFLAQRNIKVTGS